MSVQLSWTRIATLALRPQLFSGNQEAVLGGPSLPIPRAGDRFAADLTTTQLRQDDESLALMANLFEGSTADVRISVNQPNFERTFGYGAAVVDGANQSGSAIAVRSAQRNAEVRRGQMFSIVHASVHFLYMVAANTALGSDGKGVIPIWPMLRFLTIDGESIALDEPMIEGQLTGFDKGMSWSRNRTDPLSFSIVERA